MIVVAGLSPAWQRILEFDRVDPGEVNRARAVHELASGKVLNVARGLAAFRAPHRALATFGGDTGRALMADLARAGIVVDGIEVAAPTRVCTTLLDRATGVVTELVEETGPLAEAELAEVRRRLGTLLAGARTAVFTGSAPAGVPADWWAGILREHSGVRHVLDLRGPELRAALPFGPALVKPNREELAKTLGRSLASDAELRAGMREVLDLGAEAVLVTCGREPALLMDRTGTRSFAPPEVRAVNPIGSGDALTAGTALMLDLGRDLDEAVRFGIACGSANAADLFPCRLERATVDRLAKSIRRTRLA